jgi:hypothetical protein
MAKNNLGWKPQPPSWYDYTMEEFGMEFTIRAFRPGSITGHPRLWGGFGICRNKKSKDEVFRLHWNHKSKYRTNFPECSTRNEFAYEAFLALFTEYKKRAALYQAA